MDEKSKGKAARPAKKAAPRKAGAAPPPSPATAVAKREPALRPGADPSASARQTALARMGELIAAAAASGFYGHVAVEVLFVGGQPKVVRHRMDGTDKP